MRLSQDEQTAIIESISDFLQGQPAQLRLYGSRVDDNLKGGDIDLLLIVKDEETRKALSSIKYKIIARMYMKMGERRIDLTIADKQKLEDDPFLQSILPTSLIMKDFT